MTERTEAFNDPAGVGDAVQVVVKGPDGEIKHAEGVKGPDPAEWGDDADRPNPFAGTLDAGAEPIPMGQVVYDDLTQIPKGDLDGLARKHEIPGRSSMSAEKLAEAVQARGEGIRKGPGPQWERDEQGRYVNR